MHGKTTTTGKIPMNNNPIRMLEASAVYKDWQWFKHKMSLKEYEDVLMKQGAIIYHWDTEGGRKKEMDETKIYIDTVSAHT